MVCHSPCPELRPQKTPPQDLANSKCNTRCTASSESYRRGHKWNQFERPIPQSTNPKNHGKKRINPWGVDLSDFYSVSHPKSLRRPPSSSKFPNQKKNSNRFGRIVRSQLPNCLSYCGPKPPVALEHHALLGHRGLARIPHSSIDHLLTTLQGVGGKRALRKPTEIRLIVGVFFQKKPWNFKGSKVYSFAPSFHHLRPHIWASRRFLVEYVFSKKNLFQNGL